MNIFNLLAKEKHVAGIEIDEAIVRIAFFRTKKSQSFLSSLRGGAFVDGEKELLLIEESIPHGLIQEGVVLDPPALGRALQLIWAKAKLETNYAIVAIPDDKIYSRIFTFPRVLDDERINEAMSLATSFQLPFAQDDIYSDWETIGKTDTITEVLFSAIPKEVTHGFVTALSLAGIKPLALESHVDSIARAIVTEQGVPVLYTKETEDDSSIFIVKDGYIRFSRAVPTRFVPKNKFKDEVQKVKTSTEAQEQMKEGSLQVKSLVSATLQEEYVRFEKLTTDTSTWLVALGAAIRATLPEGNDALISLLPVKTGEAYAYQKAVTFIILVRNITIGVAVFFTLSFFTMYFVMLSLSQTANRSIASLSDAPVSPEVLSHEAVVKDVNELTTTAKTILSETPVWSLFLEEFSVRIIPGITVTAITAPSITGEINISGAASDRNTLNQFKKSLQDSAMFTDIVLPITNLEQKEKIAFSITFKIKDVSALYYK